MYAESALAQAFRAQADACRAYGSPFYGAFCALVADLVEEEPRLSALLSPWASESVDDITAGAAPIRFLGALHDLVLAGDAPEFDGIFPGDAEAAAARLPALLERRDARIAAFMESPPQTNEVNRSVCLLGGFLTVAAETGLPLRTFELAASAGLNMAWDRYAYDFGAAGRWGDAASPVKLAARWSGSAPPLDVLPQVLGRAAVDQSPIDLADPVAARRLQAYVWPDQAERLARLRAAIALAAPFVAVERGDAADWAERRLEVEEGAATVLYHSVAWQYFPEAVQARTRAAIDRTAATATRSAPFAWLRMEPNPDWAYELRLSLWPGPSDRLLARVHPHGAWVDWLGGD